MAREISSLGYALLGLLARQDLSGYELSIHMQVPVGYYWSVRRSQIYPELDRLEARGLVRHERVEQESRPDKKVYSITESGCASLREWVVQPPAAAPARNELMLKMYSIWLADRDEALKLLQKQEQVHHDALVLYRGNLERARAYRATSPNRADGPAFGNYLTLLWGIEYEEAAIRWCREAHREIEAWSREHDGDR